MQSFDQNLTEDFQPPPLPEYIREEPPTPNNPPWSGLMALAVWVLSVLFILIFPLFFVVPYLISEGINLSDGARIGELVAKDQTAIILQLLSIIPAHLLTLVLAWFVATKYNKYSFRETLGWKWGGFKWWHVVAIIGFFFALAGSLTAIFGEPKTDFHKILESSRVAVLLVAFFATFTAPLVEEVVYRGILYSAFQRRMGVVWAVVAVTFLFALVHVPQYSTNGVPDFVSISVILILSLVLTLVRVFTNNLLPCIVLHTIFNGIQSIFLVLEPYLPKEINAPTENPAFFIQFFN